MAKPKKDITIKIRRTTKARLEKDLAAYIGKIGKVISMAEYIDRLSKLQVK